MSASSAPMIALRLWTWAAALRVLKRVVPLETLVKMMHRRPRTATRSTTFECRLESYLERVARFPFRPPSNCLERSLGAYRMLCEANASPALVIGFRTSATRRIEGHVWVTLDGRPLAERPESVATYTAIVTFDANAKRQGTGAEPLLSQLRFT
jgi:hypothetical protein